MREYCLVDKNMNVINMSMVYKPEGPILSDYQAEKGWTWVPVSKVPQFKLRQYRYYSERP